MRPTSMRAMRIHGAKGHLHREEVPIRKLRSHEILMGSLVPAALAAVRKGGRVVCAGIHMSDIPSFPYSLLWGERSLCSVANLTRADGREFMRLAEDIDLRPAVQTFPLERAEDALSALAKGELHGAAVLTTS